MNAPAAKQTFHVACPHDCPDTCALLVDVEDSRAVRVHGDPLHPPTAGVLCNKVTRYLDRVYSPQRLTVPMKRVGRKGEGRFAPISWDEALDTIAEKFRAIAADDPQAIQPYSYAGTMGLVQGASMDRRFFNRLGAAHLDRTICSQAGTAGWRAVIGASVGMDPEALVDSRLILIWGTNLITSNLHVWRTVQEAKRRGAKLVCIDPVRSDTAARCDRHVQLLPGSDAALALAMMHVLIAEDRIDRDYVARHTVGFDELAARVREWTPQRAAAVCGIDAADIADLAREYGTTRPAAIRLGYGLQRHGGGAAAVRAIACLPALTGAWRDAAGGALLSASGNFAVDNAALERPDLRTRPARTVNMSAIGDALLELRDPPIRALYVYNSNPVAVAPDSNRVRAGFAREDLFCVVHELFLTDTAAYADILLPATSAFEHVDVVKPYGHLWAMATGTPPIAPLGEARANSEVFRLLAARMGFTEPALAESDAEIAAQAFSRRDPRTAHFDWERLAAEGYMRINVPRPNRPFAEGGFYTPSGKCEFHSAALAAQGFDPLPDYVPPHEAARSNPERAARFPLALLSPPARNFLNSSFANLEFALAAEVEPRLDLHSDDARARGIADGDKVRIRNDRGEFLARARVEAQSRVRPGVVSAPSIWWPSLVDGGHNANAVTSQALTDMGGGATFQDCLVEVERIRG